MAMFRVVNTTKDLGNIAQRISSSLAVALSDDRAGVRTEVKTKDGIAKTEGYTVYELVLTDEITDFATKLSKVIV